MIPKIILKIIIILEIIIIILEMILMILVIIIIIIIILAIIIYNELALDHMQWKWSLLLALDPIQQNHKKNGFQIVAVTVDGGYFLTRCVYEIIIDLTEASSCSRRHGAEKSGSTVLFIFHFVGVDYELKCTVRKT